MHDDDGHGGLPGFNMGSIQSLGIINALKTGDPKLDMILALLLPFALNFLLASVGNVIKFLNKAWNRYWYDDMPAIQYHERSISHRSQFNEEGYRMNLDQDNKNDSLIRALKLYLDANVDMKLKKANVDLTEAVSHNSNQRIFFGGTTIAKVLSNCRIVKNPPANLWHKLGQYGKPSALVELKIEDQESAASNDDSEGGQPQGRRSSGDKKVQVKTYHLRSLKGQAIDDFLETAYQWYLAELRKSEDTSRYYYDLEADDSVTTRRSSSRQQRTYTRFKLSSEKTFDSLFFPEKDTILKLVDNFMNKEGKYAIRGYPHKLGILLHGPPGTGKTSFIKALAEYTGRNVVNIPIAKIETNGELTSMFFDKRYNCNDGTVSLTMDFEDVIYVMEDIDAVSDIVKRRDGKKTAEVIQTSHIDIPAPKSLWRMLVESENADCKKLVKALMNKSERLKSEATQPEVVRSVTKRLNALPALGLVGETEDKILQALLNDAIKSSKSLMQEYSDVDSYLGTQAKILSRLLEDGAEVDEMLEDELLGTEKPSLPSVVKKPLSGDFNYAKYDNSDNVVVEMRQLQEAMSKSPFTFGGADKEKKGDGDFKSPYMSLLKPQDSLNLQGILNVLDGVVDTPARIIVMTTNHPEQLDPALIRPGRIDKKLHLGYMGASDISQMLEHYFETKLKETYKLRIQATIAGNVRDKRPALHLTPAQVEQMASEFETVDEMIHAIEEKASNIATAPSKLGATSSSEIAFGI